MSERHQIKRVENYTAPFLWISGLILFMAFWVVAAIGGLLPVVLSALGLNWVLRFFAEKSEP